VKREQLYSLERNQIEKMEALDLQCNVNYFTE